MDLSDPVDPRHMLVGRPGFAMARVHGRGVAGADARSPRLRLDGGPRAYQRPGRPRNVSQRHPAGHGALRIATLLTFCSGAGSSAAGVPTTH